MYIRFTSGNPNLFKLFHNQFGLYYFRNLEGKAPRIKFNLPHPGIYTSDTPFEVVKVVPLEIPSHLPSLPSYERNEIKDFTIVKNPDLKAPARVFVKDGRVETGRMFEDLPKPIKAFVILHEIGHFFYGITDKDIQKANTMPDNEARDHISYKRNESEKKCDLYAMNHYLMMGYNRCMAYYALKSVLSRSQNNVDRVKQLVNNIQKTQQTKII